MPLLSIPNTFVAGTLIQSAQVNANFQAIATLLNTTKLDTTNIQLAGVARDRIALGTANHVLINSPTGAMSSEATLAPTRGGTGLALTFTPGDAGKTIVVDPTGTGFQLSQPSGASGGLYLYGRMN